MRCSKVNLLQDLVARRSRESRGHLDSEGRQLSPPDFVRNSSPLCSPGDRPKAGSEKSGSQQGGASWKSLEANDLGAAGRAAGLHGESCTAEQRRRWPAFVLAGWLNRALVHSARARASIPRPATPTLAFEANLQPRWPAGRPAREPTGKRLAPPTSHCSREEKGEITRLR